MLIAIIVAFLLGGGAGGVMAYISDTRADAKVVIEDKDRRSEAMATLKRMEKEAAVLQKQSGKRFKQLGKALQDHEATKAEIDAIWSEHFERVDTFNREMIDLRFELREHVTREEWQQLFGNRQ